MSANIKESSKNEISTNNNEDNLHNTHDKNISSTGEDLSNIEASEETMKSYSYPKEFLKLDLEKIREFIEILEEHYQSCLEEEKITLAKATKQRIILLKRLEKEKMKLEANIIYSNQRELIQDKMKEELDNYTNTTNQEYDSLLQTFENQEVEMLKIHQKEIDEFKYNFDKIYENKKPKLSKECLNWIKIREYAIKQNNFDRAEEANREINKLMERDMKKYNENKQKKLNAELKKIIHKHDNEKNGLLLKKNSTIDMFNQTKNRNIEQIQKKYEAKLKELKNYQNFEMANFDKITKGITKPCARIQSIVSSTTGIRDEGEDEKDENNNEQKDKNENDVEGKENENKQEQGNEEEHVDDNEQEQHNEEEHVDDNEQEQQNEEEHVDDNEQEQENEEAHEDYNEQEQDNEEEHEDYNEQEQENEGEHMEDYDQEQENEEEHIEDYEQGQENEE